MTFNSGSKFDTTHKFMHHQSRMTGLEANAEEGSHEGFGKRQVERHDSMVSNAKSPFVNSNYMKRECCVTKRSD